MFASKNTKVRIPSKSITNFRKDSSFSKKFHCRHDSVFTAKYTKKGKSSLKCFSISFQNKNKEKRHSDKLHYLEAMFSSSYEQSKSKQRFSGNLAPASPKKIEFEIQERASSIDYCCHTQASCCITLIVGLSDETQMYDTNSIHLIWVNTRISAVWISKHFPISFQVSRQTNQLFYFIKRSTNASSKLETVDVLKQNNGNASKELPSAIEFSNFNVFFGLFLNSPPIFRIKAHQTKEQT